VYTTSKKTNCNCQIYRRQVTLEMVENSFASNSFTVWNFSKTTLKLQKKNLSDTPTSNRRPSISTSREKREMPWTWRQADSRHRDREFIYFLLAVAGWDGRKKLGKGRKFDRLQFINEWEFLYEYLTVDANNHLQFTNKFQSLYVQNSRRQKQKTDFNCQIYKIQVDKKWE
jgi:hypothetical protein